MSSFHLDRTRAESFGAGAEAYDRARPGPPPALIDDLLALRPRRVLDIGCGTGKIGGALAARGCEALGVEIDPRMAALAPMPVELAAFEDWADDGRTFDLATCGDAWHWLDPAAAEAKLERVLRGTFVRLWSFHELDPVALEPIDELHARLAPEIRAPGHYYAFPVEVDGEERVYRWEETVAQEDWLTHVATYSGHATHPNLATLIAELRAVLPAQLDVRYGVVSRWRAMPR